MHAPIIRPATSLDPAKLAPRLRWEDVKEVAQSSGLLPLDALHQAVEASRWSSVVEVDGGVPLAIFGIVEHTPEVGIPWMLVAQGGTEFVSHAWIGRKSRRVVAEMQKQYPLLVNTVAAWHTKPIQWLASLGFTFTQVYPEYGAARVPFIQFERRAPCATP